MDPSQSLDNLTGLVLADKYRLGSLLGAGGMGCVYAAEQLSLGRTVAIKLLYPSRFGQRGATVRAEALAASRVNHPHAVAIFDVDVTQDDVPYVVMEHLRGRTLAEVIETEPLRLQQIIRIGIQVLSALAEAHRCSVIHCDLTSDNVIVERGRSSEDFAKVIDFGLSRGAEDGRSEGVAGTPEYMAPEAIRGEPLTPRTDLYAMGILLYEMIVGRTPFAGGSLAVVIDGHLHATPPAPRENVPACPVELSDLVMWALAKDPAGRPLDADAMSAVLLSLDDPSATR
ncbi:MAG TPA: serine/threonine-protein kinase, partial [Kofleriaceae bacterium]|nr:serine/threonine-protein kinase [Kofleriaceae bacterium]